jgi:ABC-type amino acid transport substrate-binding protein
MRKTIYSTVAASAAVLALAGCGSSAGGEGAAASSENAPSGLVNDGQATLCIDPEYPPLEYYSDGSGGDIIGFDADAGRALAEHWGVEVKFEVTAFDGLMPGLQTRRCDMILGGLYMSEERLQVADAAPIMKAGPAVLTAPGKTSELASPADLCGLTVAAQAASSNAARIQALADECQADGKEAPRLTEYPKTAETVLAVLNGKADALVETNVAASYMETQNEGKLQVAPGVFETDTQFGVFSRKGDELTPAIAEGLKALYEDGTLAEIAKKYNLDPAILDVY